MKLAPAFLVNPIAHRALHDRTDGRPENSAGAVRAAIRAGYGIEIDIQLSSDGVPMVFHDYDLGRLTNESGPIAQRTALDLAEIPLKDSTETIPTLRQILDIVSGQVPLLVEVKDQDGALGPGVGALEEAAAALLRGYDGPLAVMSFNPHSMAAMESFAPDVPRGLTTCAFHADDWPTVPAATRERLAMIPDYDRVGATFISHEAGDLASLQVARLRRKGAAILCWTIRSAAAEAEARKVAQNITFEGYLA